MGIDWPGQDPHSHYNPRLPPRLPSRLPDPQGSAGLNVTVLDPHGYRGEWRARVPAHRYRCRPGLRGTLELGELSQASPGRGRWSCPPPSSRHEADCWGGRVGR